LVGILIIGMIALVLKRKEKPYVGPRDDESELYVIETQAVPAVIYFLFCF